MTDFREIFDTISSLMNDPNLTGYVDKKMSSGSAIKIPCPGYSKDDVEVSIKGARLSVKVANKTVSVFRLSSDVSAEDITVKVENGMIYITAKVDQKETKIPIK